MTMRMKTVREAQQLEQTRALSGGERITVWSRCPGPDLQGCVLCAGSGRGESTLGPGSQTPSALGPAKETNFCPSQASAISVAAVGEMDLGGVRVAPFIKTTLLTPAAALAMGREHQSGGPGPEAKLQLRLHGLAVLLWANVLTSLDLSFFLPVMRVLDQNSNWGWFHPHRGPVHHVWRHHWLSQRGVLLSPGG